jgi:3'-phosphoadenosine 5'-phosphosulfate (PAPS) 3'-phosphatase
MLIKGFKMHFPQLKIIGEETTEYEGNIDFDYSKLSTDFMPENIDIHKQNQVDDSCLWIDPIDCTKGFIEGNL